jgi:chromosome segregation ATPase
LLHRHEAYVRNQETLLAQAERNAASSRDKIESLTASNTQLLSKMSMLVKENTSMEKRLAQTSLNLEVADASNRTLLHELQDSRDSVTRLSAMSMKAVGWEARVQSLTEERDDLREEKRAESARARAAESRTNALAEKCGTLKPFLSHDSDLTTQI